MLPEGFKPGIPAVKRMQTYVFDCRATGIGDVKIKYKRLLLALKIKNAKCMQCRFVF